MVTKADTFANMCVSYN